MIAVLERCALAGIRLRLEHNALRYDAPKGAMTEALAADLLAHKAEITAYLEAGASPTAFPSPPHSAIDLDLADYDDPAQAAADAAYRRKTVSEPGYEPGAQAMYCCQCANRAADKRCLAWERIGAPEGWKPAEKAPRRCRGFEAREEAAITREAEDLREAFEERVGMLEHDAGLPRAEAELQAARIVATVARNRRYAWASLRAALASYPSCWLRCPICPARWTPCPWGYPGSPCGRTSA